jgi:hypothetical protein
VSDSTREKQRIPPVARVAYLLAVAVGLFLLRSLPAVGAVVALQLILWPAVGLPFGGLLRQLRKLSVFAAAILLTYALFGMPAEGDPSWSLGPLSIDPASTAVGLLMVLRIVGVVLASQIARAGDPRALTAGLQTLGLPESAALGLDAVLALLGEGGGRGGGGGGGGSGGGRGAADTAESAQVEGGYAAVMRWARHMRRGDLRPLLERLDDSVRRARHHVGDRAAAGSDLPVVVGIAVTMLGFKALKILPGLPYAPGHKLIIFLPLYVLAAVRTNGRFGASAVGLALGFASFLMGDGRYGIFEILKHLAPGLVCDLALPLYKGATRGVLFWSVFGALAATCRFATEFAVIALAQPPAIAYAILVPGIASNLFFGTLSGYLTRHVLTAVDEVERPNQIETDGQENEEHGSTGHRRRPHSHSVEADARVAGQSRGRGGNRQ